MPLQVLDHRCIKATKSIQTNQTENIIRVAHTCEAHTALCSRERYTDLHHCCLAGPVAAWSRTSVWCASRQVLECRALPRKKLERAVGSGPPCAQTVKHAHAAPAGCMR